MESVASPQRATTERLHAALIMIVDDDSTATAVLTALLSQHFDVVSTADPTQALALARQAMPHVILCDINMPRIRGDEVAFNLSEHAGTADIPLVYLTSLVAPDEEAELDGLFGDHLAISKGASSSELRAVVEQALGLGPTD